jgi:hypothetical protein
MDLCVAVAAPAAEPKEARVHLLPCEVKYTGLAPPAWRIHGGRPPLFPACASPRASFIISAGNRRACPRRATPSGRRHQGRTL